MYTSMFIGMLKYWDLSKCIRCEACPAKTCLLRSLLLSYQKKDCTRIKWILIILSRLAGDAFSWNQNPFNLQAMELESLKVRLFTLESESISFFFFALELESNYLLGESVLGPGGALPMLLVVWHRLQICKNVLQFLLISAHRQIQSNWVSILTYETAPLFLYNPIKAAIHSLQPSHTVDQQMFARY